MSNAVLSKFVYETTGYFWYIKQYICVYTRIRPHQHNSLSFEACFNRATSTLRRCHNVNIDTGVTISLC